jgi:transposase
MEGTLKKRLTREAFLPFMAKLYKYFVGVEACEGAHYWSSRLVEVGFTVKLGGGNGLTPFSWNLMRNF